VTLVLRYAARSDRGLVRSNNEDSVYAGARLLALADGMGGHAAGEVASQLVIAALAHLDDDEPGGDLLAKLDDAVREGNSAIAAHVEADPELEGMGTTLTAILFAGNKLGLVHIGDSRGYLLRDGELAQITKDDTFVQTLVDEGRITAEEAHSHPQRSLIMRALTGHEVEPTLIMREARAGDRYLLCSDGLSDPVSQETIDEALQITDVAESADRLIELALRGGGPDNVTVVVADVVDFDYGPTQPILGGAVSGVDDEASEPPNTSAGRASVISPRRGPPKPPEPEPETPKKKRPVRRYVIAAVCLVVLLIVGLIVGAFFIRSYYFVAVRDDTVWIMRGVPGYPLQQQYRQACLDDHGEVLQGEQAPCKPLRVQDLNKSGQALLSSGFKADSFDETLSQLRRLVKDNLLPCPGPQPATPTPGGTTTTTSPTTTTSTTAPASTAPPEQTQEREKPTLPSNAPPSSPSPPPTSTLAPPPKPPHCP
jgi:protein phosphatase